MHLLPAVSFAPTGQSFTHEVAKAIPSLLGMDKPTNQPKKKPEIHMKSMKVTLMLAVAALVMPLAVHAYVWT